MTLPELVTLICWLGFVLVWIVMAIRVKQTEQRQEWARELLYRAPLILGAYFIFKGYSHTPYFAGLDRLLWSDSGALAWFGAALALLGLGVAIWARLSLGANWSSSVTLKQSHELVTRGPYGLVRHPIYTGFLSLFLGAALSLGTEAALVGFVLVFLSCWIKLLQEEKLMRAQFPDAYPDYCKRTARLIPHVL